jgi:alpha-galactosidase
MLDHCQPDLLRALSEVLGFKSTSDPVSWLNDKEQQSLRAYLARSPEIERVGRNVFRVDGQLVDFDSAIRHEAERSAVSVVG